MSFIPIQIAPAFNWFAIYETLEHTTMMPVLCWAIGNDGNKSINSVQGMVATEDGDIVPAKRLSNFVRYEFLGETSAEFEIEAIDLN